MVSDRNTSVNINESYKTSNAAEQAYRSLSRISDNSSNAAINPNNSAFVKSIQGMVVPKSPMIKSNYKANPLALQNWTSSPIQSTKSDQKIKNSAGGKLKQKKFEYLNYPKTKSFTCHHNFCCS